MLKINEIFLSIQGEGIDTGMSALFVRMAGCNMNCHFCDTDHSINQEYGAGSLVKEIIRMLSKNDNYVIFTGGEPLLQDIYPVVQRLKEFGVRLGLETNGTVSLSAKFRDMFDSISLSPKVPRAKLSLETCTSLKILYPYLDGINANSFKHFHCQYKGIQPIDDKNKLKNYNNLIGAVQEVGRLGWPWRLCSQVHKLLNLR